MFIDASQTVNYFRKNFWLNSEESDVNTYKLKVTNSDARYIGNPNHFFATVLLRANKAIATRRWYRTYFMDFLSNMGGLITSVLGISAIFMSGYQVFV